MVQSPKSKVQSSDVASDGRAVESADWAFSVAELKTPYGGAGSGCARRFEELVVWQRARALTSEIYSATKYPAFRADPAGADQMRRAALSIGSNIAEGFERGTDSQFRQSLFYAKGSCGELRSQLYTALDAGLMSDERFEKLRALAEKISRMLQRLIEYLERSTSKPRKPDPHL
jgi:four helix bundle protein